MQWRNHPGLEGKLHPSHPDDLQVIVHDGGPRVTQLRPEAVWVTITLVEGELFSGRVLNAPSQLKTVQLNQTIRFRIDAGTGQALMVTDTYEHEKRDWKIGPCTKCGFSELFDSPSDLVRATFPDLPADAKLEAFTAFCPLCGGVQTIESLAPTLSPALKPWWKFR